MKKTGLISIFAIGFITLMMSSCGVTNNYFTDWEGPINGYITFDSNNNFTGFEMGNNPGDQANNATCYIHEYNNNSPSAYISKQTLNNKLEWADAIGPERIVFKPLNATIAQYETVELDAIYYYRDDQYIYIINNRGRYGHSETRKQGEANYRILVDMVGLRDLQIYMKGIN